MNPDWQSNPATEIVLTAASELTQAGATSLPWIVSEFIKKQFDSMPLEGPADLYAISALAACQQALCACANTPDLGVPKYSYAVQDATSAYAAEAIAAGANEIGAAGPEGLKTFVEMVLSPMHTAVMEHTDEALIHELTTWFLLALSAGPHDVGPDVDVYRGILLAYPMPEKRMVWN